MSKEDAIQLDGTVVKVLPATMYTVRLDNGHEVLAHVSGKMRKNFIKITQGDKVRIAIFVFVPVLIASSAGVAGSSVFIRIWRTLTVGSSGR